MLRLLLLLFVFALAAPTFATEKCGSGTLALDGETYKRLRLHAAETDQTHQAILEAALAEYLKRANA